MSRLIITRMEISGVSCSVCVLTEDQKIMEIQLEPESRKSILDNIYVGQVENVAANIQAAFVRIAPDVKGYLSLEEGKQAIFSSGSSTDHHSLRPGDQLLVQVSRDAMKGKLPALSGNLNFTGKYLVLTTGDKKFGLSKKLRTDDRKRLSGWFADEIQKPDKEYGLIVRTNAAEAEKEELEKELKYLQEMYKKVAVNGRSRTCCSLLYQPEPEYIRRIRDTYNQELEEIITDIPEYYQQIHNYLAENNTLELSKLRMYADKLLPLYKLYRIESAIDEIWHEKVWLSSGGFLVIQQTEAFVSIDVNTGKFTGKKKLQETYRKINLEAAQEIARQLRLRNLSGIILIDFINMENPDHIDELFHVLKKYLRKDSVRCKAVDITPLNIMEMTRKKIRRPVIEDLLELQKES